MFNKSIEGIALVYAEENTLDGKLDRLYSEATEYLHTKAAAVANDYTTSPMELLPTLDRYILLCTGQIEPLFQKQLGDLPITITLKERTISHCLPEEKKPFHMNSHCTLEVNSVEDILHFKKLFGVLLHRYFIDQVIKFYLPDFEEQFHRHFRFDHNTDYHNSVYYKRKKLSEQLWASLPQHQSPLTRLFFHWTIPLKVKQILTESCIFLAKLDEKSGNVYKQPLDNCLLRLQGKARK
jgi:hypothetical protein